MPTKLFCHLSFVFFLLACTNPFANQSLSMTTDPGVTEAWISLHVDGVRSGADYIVQRDGKTVFKGRLQSPDTVVYDSLLKPATTYTYRFFARENGDDSPALQSTLTTLDTTSHNFSWQSYEFGGQKGSSYFQDVAIIDENDIWAVGEIHTKDTDQFDSLGHWVQPYNAAHWDGQKWTLIHINGNGSPINIILAFSKNDIWFQGLLHWDGSKYTLHKKNFPLMPNGDGWRMHGTCGTSSNDFYVVGNSGMIAHYDGKGWTKIESGTDLDIQDIWGSINQKTNMFDIYYTGSNWRDLVFGKIDGNKAITLRTEGLGGDILSLWFENNLHFYLVGDGIFYKRSLDGKGNFTNIGASITNKHSNAVRGNKINDLFIVGDFFDIIHFNGLTWQKYYIKPGNLGVFNSINFKDNLVVVAGFEYQKSYIFMGRRN